MSKCAAGPNAATRGVMIYLHGTNMHSTMVHTRSYFQVAGPPCSPPIQQDSLKISFSLVRRKHYEAIKVKGQTNDRHAHVKMNCLPT